MSGNGFVLGKFMPPHAGHVFMCEAAMQRVGRLTVLVCSTDSEPIAGTLRHGWMRALLPGARVLHMHRTIPQEPQDHPDFWGIWRDAVREFHPEPIDEVFGSEAYVFRLAEELGAKPVLIDPESEVFPISGTAVRDDPASHWPLIPGVVRPYFQKRVCLMGAESTGKSTLAGLLARTFGTRFMPEYGRPYDVYYRRGEGWTQQDFVDLAATHLAMRRALAPHAGPLFVEDTDPLQTAVWALMLLGTIPSGLARLLEEMDRPGLYLLMSPEVSFVDDGTRYFGDRDSRLLFHERCIALLRDLGCRFEVVGGTDWERRTAAAQAICRNVLQTN
ncbi:MAG: AAA family ATPase [Alphaproteobacteria bacterium]|nr:AAA family ATPase [Alphaproteobacteria bacterium]